MTDEVAAREVVLKLLAARPVEATVCPSEVARVLATATGTADWRGMMPLVHAAVDTMITDGLVRLSWKGQRLVARAGPYRIGRSPQG